MFKIYNLTIHRPLKSLQGLFLFKKIFLDLKLHDIPNTIKNGIKAIEKLGPILTTIHISGGDEMQKISLLNPVLYLVSGFRWSFYEIADVSIFTSLATMLFILFSCITIISMSFAKGYKIKN